MIKEKQITKGIISILMCGVLGLSSVAVGLSSYGASSGITEKSSIAQAYAKKKKKKKKKKKVVGIYKPGTYTGKAPGYVTFVEVSVVVDSKKIKSITITKEREDQPYMDDAMKIIPSIISSQNANVNTISGATSSSKGIRNAVIDALNKAKIK